MEEIAKKLSWHQPKTAVGERPIVKIGVQWKQASEMRRIAMNVDRANLPAPGTQKLVAAHPSIQEDKDVITIRRDVILALEQDFAAWQARDCCRIFVVKSSGP